GRALRVRECVAHRARLLDNPGSQIRPSPHSGSTWPYRVLPSSPPGGYIRGWGCSQIRFPGGFPVSWQAWRIMQIGVYGSGYLGTVVSACLADFGTPVTCCHPDSSRMVEMAQGNVPFFEK